MPRWMIALSLALFCASPSLAEERVGEFSIPKVHPLARHQVERLRELAHNDPEAKALAQAVREAAQPLLDIEPAPLKVIHYEGLVNTDPRRIATVKQLRQMGDAARLMRFWQVSDDPRAAAALQRLILAWTQTYELTGNDVNENKFYPLLVAYHALRDQFDSPNQQRLDDWVERLGRLHKQAVENSTHFTNRYSKHVRLLAICGMILKRDAWIEAAHEGIKRFVTQSLYADGSSHDLKRRDTLTYHASALRPPIELAMLAGEQGRELYHWTSPQGGAIKKSVDFVVPYALGEKVHLEWVNSQIDLDRRRAEAGIDYYQPGRPFDPQSALRLMEEASYFDASLMRVVHHLTDSSAQRFPTWQTLVNQAARAEGVRSP